MLELPPRLRAGVLAVALAVAAAPSASADLREFEAQCRQGGAFLLGELPAGGNADRVLEDLCPCLESAFASYTQAEIDALSADLRTGSSYEAKATYPAYQALQAKASEGLKLCLGMPEVARALAGRG